MTLAQLVGSVAHNGLKVHIIGNFPSESLIQQIVFGSAGKILHPANDVIDTHKVVVHDVCEVISRHTVGFYEYIIFEVLIFHRNIPENHVVIS